MHRTILLSMHACLIQITVTTIIFVNVRQAGLQKEHTTSSMKQCSATSAPKAAKCALFLTT